MHFQHNTYNLHIERFHKMLDKFPKVNFIGHAQTWWANIDRNCDQVTMYPKGTVAGGITDRLLSDYPNMYGDLSAGSGLNSMLRDEDHARAFLERHQEKLMFGSDCTDTLATGTSAQERKFWPSPAPGPRIEDPAQDLSSKCNEDHQSEGLGPCPGFYLLRYVRLIFILRLEYREAGTTVEAANGHTSDTHSPSFAATAVSDSLCQCKDCLVSRCQMSWSRT